MARVAAAREVEERAGTGTALMDARVVGERAAVEGVAKASVVAARAAEVRMVAATAVASWVVVARLAVEREAAARVASGRGPGTGVREASRVGRVDGGQLGCDSF